MTNGRWFWVDALATRAFVFLQKSCFPIPFFERIATIMGSSTSRVQKHRAAMRAAGLRPVQTWVPDTRRAGFAVECHLQSLSLLDDVHEGETLDWLAAAADKDTWVG